MFAMLSMSLLIPRKKGKLTGLDSDTIREKSKLRFPLFPPRLTLVWSSEEMRTVLFVKLDKFIVFLSY